MSQCQGITLQDTQCQHPVEDGRIFCHQHQPPGVSQKIRQVVQDPAFLRDVGVRVAGSLVASLLVFGARKGVRWLSKGRD